ncbi:MAG TPA: hypothetical protein VGO73_04065 [Pyrinomonadaceae bacterium]|nr:hypothetical protein [Pyrinomonadaceae bacterium]
MPSSIKHVLDQLDALKSRFGSREHSSVTPILSRLSRLRFSDAETLLRYHEILLFLRAYPQSEDILRFADRELSKFAERVQQLETTGADLSVLEHPEASGIAGMSVTDTFSYYIVRWLVRSPAGRVALDWDWFEDENRLAETWPRFMPLLEEDASVEANVPYREWLQAAAGSKRRELSWLMRQFDRLQRADKEKAELYDSQKLYVNWTPSYRESRSGMRLPSKKIFYHRDPLIQRRDISLRRELEQPAPPLKQLSAKQGEAILNLTRAASTIRYRELYGFTHGDLRRVLKTNLGRGVDLFIIGLPSGKRLPLRAYHAAMIFKNGVPVGYFEGISLFERMESGFNLYYTFRDGETAWLYARLLNTFHHLLGVTAFSIDPYQIGYENEEGIESGAFWFYRKLGFRPTRPEVTKLVLSEEKKIASRKNYRTNARTLRKLAEGPMIFELEKSPGNSKAGDWDRFQVRSIGLSVQRQMSARHGGNAETLRSAAIRDLTRVLGTRLEKFWKIESDTLSDFAVALSLVEDLDDWRPPEKQALAHIIHAKATQDESSYLKLMQKHTRLRRALIELGSL